MSRAGLDVKIHFVEKFYHFMPLMILKRKMAIGSLEEELEELVWRHVESVINYICRFRNRDRAHYEWVYEKIPWLRRRINKCEIKRAREKFLHGKNYCPSNDKLLVKGMYRDVLVIGAGVLGLSSALHLKRLNPDKRVTVIDKLGGPGQGNTAKCAGIFLNLFTSEINYLLGDSTINWFFHLKNELGYKLNLAKYGYLFLLNEARLKNLKGAISKMQSLGIDMRTIEKENLERMMPDLVTDFSEEETELMGLKPVKAGVLGVKCGTINTDALARSLESEFLKLEGEVNYNTAATELMIRPEKELGINDEPFVWQDIQVVGANTSKGNIYAEKTVIAAGVWSERLLDPIGFDSMMKPKKRVIFVFKDQKLRRLRDAKGFSRYNVLPFTHIPEINVYMKVELTEDSIWVGCADDFGRKYGLEDDPQPEKNLYSNNIYYALIKYMPCFKDVLPVNMWAGQRAINRYDKTPVVAPAPGMIYVGSATGYGITKCDALGRTVAALYSAEEEVELFDGRRFKTANLGIETRNVGKEIFNA